MGKPTEGNQKGPQGHAEGQHGDKTRQRLKDQINDEGAQAETHSKRAAHDPNREGKRSQEAAAEHERFMEEDQRDGRHRIMEERHQHDPADRASGKNRLMRDVSRHEHDREQFQIPGGRETHPALPPDDPEGTIKSPMGGGK
jgi:hypothetical protein